MRILCIDWGEARIGIAVSDPLGILAQPVEVIKKQKDFHLDLIKLKEIIGRYQDISEIVVGLPKTMRNEIGPQGRKTLEYVDFLKDKLPIPVVTWDERLTTASASALLREAGLDSKKQRKVIDKVAAAQILQSYLDRKKQ